MSPFLRFRKNVPHGPATRRAPVKRRPQAQFRPHLEALEDRLAPATHVWSGAVSTLWSNAGNWSSGGSPQGDPDAVLTFPSSNVARFTSTNDLPGTVDVAQINLKGNGYTLNGGVISNLFNIIATEGTGSGRQTIDFEGIIFRGTAAGQGFGIGSFSTLNVRSPIAGGGTIPLRASGGGTLILSGGNVSSGGMILESGTLVVGDDIALGSGTVEIRIGGTIESSASVTLANRLIVSDFIAFVRGSNNIRFTGDVQIAANAKLSVGGSGFIRFDGILFGPGGLQTADFVVLDLAGNNTYEGGTSIGGGVVRVENNNALGRGPLGLDGRTITRGAGGGPNITLSNPFGVFNSGRINNAVGELTLSGPGTLTGDLEVTGGTGDIGFPLPPPVVVRLSGALSGPGGLTMATQSGVSLGNYTLILSGNAANTYTGTTTVEEGTLLLNKPAGVNAIAGPLVIGDGHGPFKSDVVSLGASNQIADSAPITIIFTGLLKLNNFNEALGSVEDNGYIEYGDPPTLTVGFNNLSTTFGGVISGPGLLVKVGTGTWTLTGNNTYTGGTTVNGGTLLVNGSITGPVTVNAGATLGGTGSTGPVTLSAGAAVSPGGAVPGIQRVHDLAFAPGSSFVVQLNGLGAGTGYDQLDVTGSVSLNGATLNASLGFSPAPGESFVIIKNDGMDSVAGTFAGLPQGAALRIGGVGFHIYYDRGDGNNDVVLVRNVPPAVAVPGDQTAFQNVDLAISGISVGDPEDANLSVTLHASHGTLTLGTVAGLTVGGNGTAAVSLFGSQAALNAALAGLTYRGDHNFSGSDTLTVTASDGHDTTSAGVAIRVKSLAEQAADLQAQVNALRAAGVLNQGQANSLLVKLNLKNNDGDSGRVQSFLNELEALLRAGVLSPTQADPLLGAGTILLTGLRRR